MLLLFTQALASSSYPGDIADQLGLDCTPQCTVCHESNSGGSGTVVQAFGVALTDRGLTGGANNAALQTALASLESDAVDSDGDGTTDVDELIGGVDPNPDGAAFCNVVTPSYGCFNSTPAPASGVALLGALVAFGIAVRRR